MAIGLDKILTVSAEIYCESEEKHLRDFKLIGVHAFGVHASGIKAYDVSHDFPKESLAERVPDSAEVVVNYKPVISRMGNKKEGKIFYEANGTALIPKKSICKKD